jgi:hypothetical protein
MFDTFDHVQEVHMEPAGYDGAIRVIAFQVDPDLGARSVADIIEADSTPRGIRFLAQLCADYTERSTTPVTYTGTFGRTANSLPQDEARLTLDQVDTGRARTLRSKLQKMIQKI